VNDFLGWIKSEGRYFAIIVLGIFGGCVQSANDPDMSFRRFVVGIATAAFVSILAALLLADTELSFSLKAAIVGLSGYSAAKSLEVLNRIFLRRLERLAAEAEGKKDA
jgi:hypothetical protein